VDIMLVIVATMRIRCKNDLTLMTNAFACHKFWLLIWGRDSRR
jgi:hypothetical protein